MSSAGELNIYFIFLSFILSPLLNMNILYIEYEYQMSIIIPSIQCTKHRREIWSKYLFMYYIIHVLFMYYIIVSMFSIYL